MPISHLSRSTKLSAVVLLLAWGLAALSASSATSANAASTTPRGGRGTLAPRATSTVSGSSDKMAGTMTALAGKGAATATALYVKSIGSATAFASKVAPTLTALANNLKITATVPADEASAAITTYASEVLGTAVTVKKASGLTADVTNSLTQTQASAEAQAAVVKLAVKTYGATLSNGVASLSYGSGSVSGDVSIDVQGASLGVYSLAVSLKDSLTSESALALALATFPDLAGLDYSTYSVSTGYAWYAVTTVSAIDPKQHKVVTMAQTVILYVLPASGGKTASVSATVGRGDFAELITVPSK